MFNDVICGADPLLSYTCQEYSRSCEHVYHHRKMKRQLKIELFEESDWRREWVLTSLEMREQMTFNR